MNKLYLLLLFIIGSTAFGQQKGISYQAVIINPNEIKAPGYNATAIPLANKAICMSFKIVNSANQVEYQESQSITTDSYGMINVVIGTGRAGTGLVSTLEAVAWNQGNKKLVVGVNIDGACSNYTEISNQILNYTPYSFYALNADLKDGSVTDAKVATGINPAKVGLGNVNNTSDANKPVSTAVKTYVDTAIAGATIVDADPITKGKIQLTGDLGGTAGAPTVPGLALKLDASQKGVPNGLATLNSAGIIPSSQLPPVSVSSTNVVASQADMLALSNATVGSIAVRTDVNKNYILAVAGPTVLANWIELLTPGAPVQTVNGMTGSVVLTKSNVGLANVDNTSDTAKPISSATQNALNLKLNTNQVGVANGTASLDALGKIPTDQIPAISFSSVKVLNSQADMLALSSAVIGSVVIRTDINKNYVLSQANPSVLANWIELLTPAPPVQTVNGYTGSVSIMKSDIGLANVDNTSDTNKPVSAAQQTALNLKADITSLATVATSGDYNDLSNKPITPNPSLTEVTDEFTATASQTSFTLTQTKSVNSKVKMFINGVRISNTAYTVSGNILTYIPASNGGYNLTAGNRIQFDYSY